MGLDDAAGNGSASARSAHRTSDEGAKARKARIHGRSSEKGGSLQDFYSYAVRLVRSKVTTWRAIWEAGPVSTIRRTKTFLDKLNVGASDYLDHGRVFEIPVDPEHEDRKFGMCGTLRSYLPEGELM